MEQIRKGCEAAGCEIPVGVSFDIGLSCYGGQVDVTGSDGVRVKFSLPFLHNAQVQATTSAPCEPENHKQTDR